jgi:tRNA A-37 threonylcarbamoyl transferase component Bud32/tetratricopeptide (TPR) repeat protein
MTCLDDDAVSAYIEHRLSAAEQVVFEAHLSICELCLTLVCSAARSDDTVAAESPERARMGRYEIIAKLGEGAMGSVYVAHDPQLDRRVAIKLVRADRAAHAQMHARLAREARMMAQIRHPNVVAVYDAGELADGVFVAMELIDGETLRSWLVRAQRSWQDIVKAFIAAGNGLEAAHTAGVVHRDFKPDNVMVARDGRIAVTDFGVAVVGRAESEDLAIAETASSEDLRDPLLSRAGALIGTPRYMSPEQFRGDEIDPRTDQFSFAVSLYEALYGEPPFRASSIAELVHATANEVRSPPAASVVPARIGRALMRALGSERSSRFSTMRPLLDELERASAPPRRARWRMVAAAAGLLATGSVVAGVAFTSRPHTAVVVPAASRTKLLIAPLENHTGVHELDGTLDAFAGELASASTRFDAVAGPELESLAARFGVSATDIDVIAEKTAATAAVVTVRGTIDGTNGNYALHLEARSASRHLFGDVRTFSALDQATSAVADLTSAMLAALGDRTLSNDERHVLSTSLPAIAAWVQGQRAAIAGDQAAAAAGFRRALELDPKLTEARASLGLTLYNLEDKPAAITELERAVRDGDLLPERKRLTLLGDYYGTIGRFSESILAYQQLLAKWPGDGRTQLNLTATAIDANSWPLALETARTGVHDHGQFEVAWRNLVIAEVGSDQFNEAIRDGSGIPSPSTAALTSTAIAYVLAGRTADARRLNAKLEPAAVPHATADLAAFEGRLDDAAGALATTKGQLDQLMLAWVKLRQGDHAAALVAARIAMTDDSMPLAYLAAAAALEAGDPAGAREKVAEWSEAPESFRRMYGALLAGDLALAAGKPGDALASYRAAGRIGDGWLVHERIARAATASGDPARAETELRWCQDHRGQAALVANPSLALLPPVYLAFARSLDARHADRAAVRSAYQAVVDLSPSAQHDPITEEASRHLLQSR